MRPSCRLPLILAIATLSCADPAPPPLARETLVGDAVCASCHVEQARGRPTAHTLTSAPPTDASIRGSFAAGENRLTTSNPYLHFRLSRESDGFWQHAVAGPAAASATTSARIALVIGSGRRGQSYLHWRGNRLYQLPVSYWAGVGWVNSPGFMDGVANFDRPVTPRCLECHSTFARSLGGNAYDTTSLVLGITCENCHGPGLRHVETRGARGIVNPAHMPRERKVDGCALCHGGAGESVQPPFSYIPGDPLSLYLRQTPPPPGAPPDVHGNQVALLASSLCYRMSEMSCSTCHDVHRPQRHLAEFEQVCASCHSMPPAHGTACVDCHMPVQETNLVVSGGRRARLRTHRIAVY